MNTKFVIILFAFSSILSAQELHIQVADGKRVLFGADTIGSGDKLMFLPDLHAFRVGTVATGAASTYWNRDSIGLYSFASGYNTRAQGFGATATGRDTEATNSYAFASGFFSNADGQYSTAMGFNTDAFGLGSTALGYNNDAEANYTFATGYFAEAQGIFSIAIGNAVRAQSHSSMAIGRHNVGGGNDSSWVSTDPIFEIGIGGGSENRENAMTVIKNGNIGIGTHTPDQPLAFDNTLGPKINLFDATGIYGFGMASAELQIGTFDNTKHISLGHFSGSAKSFAEWMNFNGGSKPLSMASGAHVTSGGVWTDASSRSFKENIKDLSIDEAVSTLRDLNPVKFNYILQKDEEYVGFIAEDVPDLIATQDRKSLSSMDIVAVLTKVVQKQQIEIVNLKTQTSEMNSIKREIAELKSLLTNQVEHSSSNKSY